MISRKTLAAALTIFQLLNSNPKSLKTPLHSTSLHIRTLNRNGMSSNRRRRPRRRFRFRFRASDIPSVSVRDRNFLQSDWRLLELARSSTRSFFRGWYTLPHFLSHSRKIGKDHHHHQHSRTTRVEINNTAASEGGKTTPFRSLNEIGGIVQGWNSRWQELVS